MRLHLLSLLLAGAAALLGPGIALCADAATEVDEIVVTGHIEETLPQTLEQYGNRLVTVTDQRVQDGGYVDVGQVLASEVPGLSLIPQSGPFSYNTASLQGSRTNEILYLVDGVRISNRLYNTTPPLDTVPAHMVQRIEVLQGGQGLFFGTQAVAGVINIVTRDFTDAPHGRLEAGGNSNEGWNVNGYASRPWGRTGSWPSPATTRRRASSRSRRRTTR
jgi:vitamin B12 transporter